MMSFILVSVIQMFALASSEKPLTQTQKPTASVSPSDQKQIRETLQAYREVLGSPLVRQKITPELAKSWGEKTLANLSKPSSKVSGSFEILEWRALPNHIAVKWKATSRSSSTPAWYLFKRVNQAWLLDDVAETIADPEDR